jgi:hypothetical protein
VLFFSGSPRFSSQTTSPPSRPSLLTAIVHALGSSVAHQSLADLELVSKEFATAVWDNTCTKDILHQDSPELCDRIAKTLGTEKVSELTVRRKQGPLLTSLSTGEASSRMVDAYRLHPNAIKGLARSGQGYLLSDGDLKPIAYGMLPPALSASYELPRNQQREAKGLRLYETFVAAGASVDRDTKPLNASVLRY